MQIPLRAIALALGGCLLAGTSFGTVLYSGDQNLAIPADFTGIYLDFNNPADPSSFTTSTGAAPATWDFNFFFGGAAVASSDTSLPVTATTTTNSAILRLAEGDALPGTLDFQSGFSGSTGHMGAGTNQWSSGDTGYIGFILNPGVDNYYGWMNVTLRDDGTPGQINWWAWDDTALATTIVPEVSTFGVSAVCLLSGLLLQRRRRRVAE